MATKTKSMRDGQTTVTLPTGLASFPNLFKPKAMMEGKEPEFSTTVLLDKSADLSALELAIKNAIAKKFPEGAPAGLRLPIKDGDQKKDKSGKVRPEYAGKTYVQVKCRQDDAPRVFDGRLEAITDTKAIYGGCPINVLVNAYAYNNQGNRGVSLYLKQVQKAGDGESFGAAEVDPEDVFDIID